MATGLSLVDVGDVANFDAGLLPFEGAPLPDPSWQKPLYTTLPVVHDHELEDDDQSLLDAMEMAPTVPSGWYNPMVMRSVMALVEAGVWHDPIEAWLSYGMGGLLNNQSAIQFGPEVPPPVKAPAKKAKPKKRRMPDDGEAKPAAKRRRANNGNAIAIIEAPVAPPAVPVMAVASSRTSIDVDVGDGHRVTLVCTPFLVAAIKHVLDIGRDDKLWLVHRLVKPKAKGLVRASNMATALRTARAWTDETMDSAMAIAIHFLSLFVNLWNPQEDRRHAVAIYFYEALFGPDDAIARLQQRALNHPSLSTGWPSGSSNTVHEVEQLVGSRAPAPMPSLGLTPQMLKLKRIAGTAAPSLPVPGPLVEAAVPPVLPLEWPMPIDGDMVRAIVLTPLQTGEPKAAELPDMLAAFTRAYANRLYAMRGTVPPSADDVKDTLAAFVAAYTPDFPAVGPFYEALYQVLLAIFPAALAQATTVGPDMAQLISLCRTSLF